MSISVLRSLTPSVWLGNLRVNPRFHPTSVHWNLGFTWEFPTATSVSVNFASLVTSCVGLQEETQTAYRMSLTWASHIAASLLTGQLYPINNLTFSMLRTIMSSKIHRTTFFSIIVDSDARDITYWQDKAWFPR